MMRLHLMPFTGNTAARTIFKLALALACSLGVLAEDWPQWRGPNHNGISSETNWTDRWPDAGPTVLWKSSIGIGFSSFVVADGRVFTAGHGDGKDTIFAFDAASGKELWKHSYAADLGDKYFEGGTTGTPTVDGDHVYTLSRWGDAFCFEARSGKVLWNRNVQIETGAKVPDWGFSGSPLVVDKMLFLNVGEAGLALDKASGKTLWHSSDMEAGYATPFLWELGGARQAVLASGKAYIGVDIYTGKELWRMKWLTQYGVNAADPVPHYDRLFISSGYGKGAALIKPMANAEPQVVWKGKVLRTQMNAAILLGGYLYGMDGDTSDKPTLKCIEAATGTENWSNTETAARGLLIAGGRMILLGEKGELIVAPATPTEFKPNARAQVLGGRCWTAPILANGLLYCRNSRGDTICLDLRPTAAKQ